MSFLKNYNYFLFLLLIGCSSSSNIGISKKPSWINTPPYGVVVSDTDERIAKIKAQRALAFYYKSKIESKNNKYNNKFSSSIQSTKVHIKGYIKAKYVLNGLIYIWYVPKGKYIENRDF